LDFEVSIDEHMPGVSLLSVRGEVDLHTAPRLEEALERAATNGSVVVVDMSGIRFIDSTALATFLRARDQLSERNTSLRLVAPSQAVERLFTVTGFHDYFEVFATREEALP
jgi:anti-sigma B factor antagonist